MKRSLRLAVIRVVSSMFAIHAAEGNDRVNPKMFGGNNQPPHCTLMPFESFRQAGPFPLPSVTQQELEI